MRKTCESSEWTPLTIRTFPPDQLWAVNMIGYAVIRAHIDVPVSNRLFEYGGNLFRITNVNVQTRTIDAIAL